MIRGRIVVHRLRVCPTLTRAPSRRRPRPLPPRRTPPGPHRGPHPAASWWRRRGLAGEVAFVRRGGWRRTVGVIVLVFLLVVLVAAFVASHVQINYYVITPGQASPVSQYISVPPAYRHPLTGKILLDRRLRFPAERAQLPAVPLLRFRQRDLPGRRAAGGRADRGPVPQPGLPADGPGSELRHGSRADPPRLPGELLECRRAGLRHPGQVAGGGDPPGGRGDRGGRCQAHADGVRADPGPARLRAGHDGDVERRGVHHQQRGGVRPRQDGGQGGDAGHPAQGHRRPQLRWDAHRLPRRPGPDPAGLALPGGHHHQHAPDRRPLGRGGDDAGHHRQDERGQAHRAAT